MDVITKRVDRPPAGAMGLSLERLMKSSSMIYWILDCSGGYAARCTVIGKSWAKATRVVNVAMEADRRIETCRRHQRHSPPFAEATRQ
jgi:hypothetical protein